MDATPGVPVELVIGKSTRPTRVATGEHVANRVIFKQMLQVGATTCCSSTSPGSRAVTENIAILLLAAEFGAPEVAAAIAYLASPPASATTGTALSVGGGMAGLRLRGPQ